MAFRKSLTNIEAHGSADLLNVDFAKLVQCYNSTWTLILTSVLITLADHLSRATTEKEKHIHAKNIVQTKPLVSIQSTKNVVKWHQSL